MKQALLFLLVSAISPVCFAQQPLTGNHPDTLPQPFATKSVSNFSNVIGWEDGAKPRAPEGFMVTKYADGFDNPAGPVLHREVISWWSSPIPIIAWSKK